MQVDVVRHHAASRWSCVLLLVALLAGLGGMPETCTALEVPPPPRGRVLDQAGLLSAQGKRNLETRLIAFERETSNQVAVAIFESLEGEPLEDFTIRLAEAWQPGQADRDNGVILAVFVKDRKVRIEVGYGLEGALPDALAGRIIRDVLAPEFRAGRFDQGITRSADAIMAATQGEYEALPVARSERRKPSGSRLGMLLFFFFIIFMSGGFGRRHRGFSGRGMLAGYLLGSLFGGGRGRGGGGFGGGGLGGGGFGGGGFGGGGASGGW